MGSAGMVVDAPALLQVWSNTLAKPGFADITTTTTTSGCSSSSSSAVAAAPAPAPAGAAAQGSSSSSPVVSTESLRSGGF